MAGPQQQEVPPTGEEERVRRQGSQAKQEQQERDEKESFAGQERFRRHFDATAEALNKRREEIRERIRNHDQYLRDIDEYEARLKRANGNKTQTWIGVDGSRLNLTYQDLLDYIGEHTDDEGQDAVFLARQSLDNHPSAILAAEKAGFSFVDQNDIDPLDMDRTEANLHAKAESIRFLNDMIVAYNEGEYEPYYDRKEAHKILKNNISNIDTPFNSRFKPNKDVEPYDSFFEDIGKEYGVDAKTAKQWYEQADRVILSYERDKMADLSSDPDTPLTIDVDYGSLYRVSGASAVVQRRTNQDGIYVDGFFDVIKDSARAHYEAYDAEIGLERSARMVDEEAETIEALRESMGKENERLDKEIASAAGVSGGLRQMYSAEMDRYRSGYTQQPPLMWDIAKRWAKGQTRFLDGRYQAKQQMRDQKWTEKTGINERGIKTDGSLGDFFKSIVRECRRELYKSGVADFTLIGDTERLLLACAIDKVQRAFAESKVKDELQKNADVDKEISDMKRRKTSGKTDAANYTRAIQIASEAKHGTRFNGAEDAAKDYDGRDNNPADVMAGWDDANEWSKDKEQQERNLQNLIDDKGYNTNDDENDGPRLLGGPDAE